MKQAMSLLLLIGIVALGAVTGEVAPASSALRGAEQVWF